MKIPIRIALTIALCVSSIPLFSQQSGPLYEEIRQMDSSYFAAQNACDLEKYGSFLSEDFEVFHDRAGHTASKDDEMDDMAIFCGEEQRSRQPLRRELVEGTLKVYPMDNYGALQFCDHLFYLQISDGSEKVVGSGRLTAIWKKIDGQWKLTRVVSYDHQQLAEVELPAETLNQYVGDYEVADRVVNIKIEGKFLRVTDIIDGKPGWSRELFPEADNLFYLNYENVVYEFLKEGGKVTKLNIYERGELLEEAVRRN